MKNLNQAIYYFNCFFFDPFVSFDVFVFNNNISILLILANLLFFLWDLWYYYKSPKLFTYHAFY